MSTNPVEYDDLIYTEAHIFVFDGQPFTGVAEARYANGNLSCRFRFRDGEQHGIAEEYFLSGSTRMLTPYVDGAAHGHKTEWHENGVIKIERDIEFGFLIHEREFDETGKLIDEYIRPEDDATMLIVKALRREGDS